MKIIQATAKIPTAELLKDATLKVKAGHRLMEVTAQEILKMNLAYFSKQIKFENKEQITVYTAFTFVMTKNEHDEINKLLETHKEKLKNLKLYEKLKSYTEVVNKDEPKKTEGKLNPE